MALQLYIGHKNYSSWSMPPWVLMHHMGIEFQERNATADTDANSIVKHQPSKTNPLEKASLSVKVPVLVEEGFVVWDTLAIVEYLAERFPEYNVWPTDRLARARARSIFVADHLLVIGVCIGGFLESKNGIKNRIKNKRQIH